MICYDDDVRYHGNLIASRDPSTGVVHLSLAGWGHSVRTRTHVTNLGRAVDPRFVWVSKRVIRPSTNNPYPEVFFEIGFSDPLSGDTFGASYTSERLVGDYAWFAVGGGPMTRAIDRIERGLTPVPVPMQVAA